mmetsp:Transcript_47246/g.117931  ORF Transcript_47246/g.117931 Transcript_47246/m.117931 type:complete len:334 (-) Transcript_47246:1402-2403(-)
MRTRAPPPPPPLSPRPLIPRSRPPPPRSRCRLPRSLSLSPRRTTLSPSSTSRPLTRRPSTRFTRPRATTRRSQSRRSGTTPGSTLARRGASAAPMSGRNARKPAPRRARRPTRLTTRRATTTSSLSPSPRRTTSLSPRRCLSPSPRRQSTCPSPRRRTSRPHQRPRTLRQRATGKPRLRLLKSQWRRPLQPLTASPQRPRPCPSRRRSLRRLLPQRQRWSLPTARRSPAHSPKLRLLRRLIHRLRRRASMRRSTTPWLRSRLVRSTSWRRVLSRTSAGCNVSTTLTREAFCPSCPRPLPPGQTERRKTGRSKRDQPGQRGPSWAAWASARSRR